MSVNDDINTPEKWDESNLQEMIPNPALGTGKVTNIIIRSGHFTKDGNKVVPMTDEGRIELEFTFENGVGNFILEGDSDIVLYVGKYQDFSRMESDYITSDFEILITENGLYQLCCTKSTNGDEDEA